MSHVTNKLFAANDTHDLQMQSPERELPPSPLGGGIEGEGQTSSVLRGRTAGLVLSVKVASCAFLPCSS